MNFHAGFPTTGQNRYWKGGRGPVSRYPRQPTCDCRRFRTSRYLLTSGLDINFIKPDRILTCKFSQNIPQKN